MSTGRVGFNMLMASVIVCSMAVITQQVFAQAEKGIALYNSRGYTEAEGVLKEALKSDSTNVQARYYLGLSLLEQKKFDEALGEFKNTESYLLKWDQWTRPIIPNEYQIQLALARTNLALKKYDEAGRNLQLARIEDSSSSEIYLYYGIFYLDQKKYPEAIEALEKAVRLDSKNAYAHYYAGIAYSESGAPDKAATPFRTFLQLAPDAPEAAKAKSMIQ
jgi:tetratricopeptide (TPR) repeat protein